MIYVSTFYAVNVLMLRCFGVTGKSKQEDDRRSDVRWRRRAAADVEWTSSGSMEVTTT